jgi:osmotically inducible protein OsmC
MSFKSTIIELFHKWKSVSTYFQLINCARFTKSAAVNSNTEEEPVMPLNVLYETSATAIGGRVGQAATADGNLKVVLARPKELGGAGGAGTNPEQLFAAGYAACFVSSMQFVATQGGPKVPADASVTATVGIGPRADGGFGLEVALQISLPGLTRSDAETLVRKAHGVCPYSNATRNSLDVRLSIL